VVEFQMLVMDAEVFITKRLVFKRQ